MKNKIALLWGEFKSKHPKLFGEAEMPDGPAPAPEAPAETPPVMKQVGEEMFPATDFLSVPDPTNAETWALQVRRNGEVDPALLGEAQMALMGDGYTGEDKPEMLEALKALYVEAGLEWPGNTPAECAKWAQGVALRMRLAESYLDYATPYGGGVPWGAKTFGQIKTAKSAQQATQTVIDLSYQLCELVSLALGDSEVSDKMAAFSTLVKEYQAEAEAALKAMTSGDTTPEATAEESTAPTTAQFKESASCAVGVMDSAPRVADIGETEMGTGRRGPVDIEIIPIRPGPGNKRDGNYYTAELLARVAHRLVGVHIHTTDHKDSDRSDLTKVGKVKELLGFTALGEPRYRATIFGADHAEKVRNQSESGDLGSLEFSIYGSGKSRPAEVDGQKFNLVEDIDTFHYLDCVTSAGAGGRAVKTLTESASGTPAAPKPTSIMSDAAVLKELGMYPAMGADTRKRILQARVYANAAEVHAAADSELQYLKEHSGRAPTFEDKPANNEPRSFTEKEIAERQNRINQKYLGR